MTLILFMILVISGVVNAYVGNWTTTFALWGLAWTMIKAHNAHAAADSNNLYLKSIYKKLEEMENNSVHQETLDAITKLRGRVG